MEVLTLITGILTILFEIKVLISVRKQISNIKEDIWIKSEELRRKRLNR